jgi:hypothetical protein
MLAEHAKLIVDTRGVMRGRNGVKATVVTA